MNNYIYKVKNTLFAFSKESKKLKRPSYEDLKKYQDFQRKENNYLALSFGSGKSGQNWFSKIFNSHSNWVGTCERFAEFRARMALVFHQSFGFGVSYGHVNLKVTLFRKLNTLPDNSPFSFVQRMLLFSFFLLTF